jgi:hypothetical protein
MGVRRRLFELINGKLPSWASGSLRYEGMTTPIDPELKGKARFAKKLGHPLPVWVVDTSTSLVADANTYATYLDVEPNDWMTTGARIRLDQRYDVVVSDVSNNGSRLHLSTPVEAPFLAGTEVTIFSYPVTVSGTYTAPVTLLVVHSQYDIYRGDVLVFSKFHEVEVATSVRTGTSGDGRGVYAVTLTQAVLEDQVDESTISLRAYPAYESAVQLIPDRTPFVFDRLSGVFYEDMEDIREVDTVILRDDASDPVMTLPGKKNLAVYLSPIPTDMLLFGRRRQGKIKWDGTKQCIVLIPNENNRAFLEYTLTPAWEPGQTTGWTWDVESTVDARLVVTMPPGAKVVVDLLAGTPQTVSIPMPTANTSTIEIRVYSQDETAEVRIRSIDPQGSMPIRTISYITVAHVSGPWLWGSTGALVKRPLRLSDVTAYADLGGALSSGFYVG